MWMLLFKEELLLAGVAGRRGRGVRVESGVNLPLGSINLHRDGEFLARLQVVTADKRIRAPA